eukprot:CAMPEP_0201662654 /NCGR_PEP_ID=MMETSP0494-20130426/4700_1 /ASSEMBLY_ACC=CAM_ASM_000839 /TAXON_ID=420259 /ORGANISM="Thalassiosira gravida, Strain GMp14c1" /LENGTH=189 /DNA_ID=CAMNT_0048141085 /DNA_START=101 /DNA_END=667 /DNA_ORIENTATION=+
MTEHQGSAATVITQSLLIEVAAPPPPPVVIVSSSLRSLLPPLTTTKGEPGFNTAATDVSTSELVQVSSSLSSSSIPLYLNVLQFHGRLATAQLYNVFPSAVVTNDYAVAMEERHLEESPEQITAVDDNNVPLDLVLLLESKVNVPKLPRVPKPPPSLLSVQPTSTAKSMPISLVVDENTCCKFCRVPCA